MIILLDIDGVMVPAKSWQQPDIYPDGFFTFTPHSVAALNRIIAAGSTGHEWVTENANTIVDLNRLKPFTAIVKSLNSTNI